MHRGKLLDIIMLLDPCKITRITGDPREITDINGKIRNWMNRSRGRFRPSRRVHVAWVPIKLVLTIAISVNLPSVLNASTGC